MLKYLVFCLLLAPSSVWAAASGEVVVEDHDKEKDIFYKFGGGARMRQYYIRDSTSGAIPFEEDYINTSHRAQLDLSLSKGEYIKTFFRAIHHSVWGEEDPNQDSFILQQAWGDWKVTDFLNLKFGRQSVEVGRGLVYGANEWENVPTFYDGFAGLFDWDVMELSLFALKIHELDRDVTSVSSDPETTHYVIDVNFKELSDIIQMADLNFSQVVSDIGLVSGTTTLLKKQRIQRFGFDFVLSGVYFESATTLNYIAGEENTLTVTEKVKQLMMDGEIKFMMPNWDQFNIWLGAHYDSGDDDATDGSNTQYEAFNYNLHNNAGRMDFFKFGNLTFARAGFSMHLLSDWYFGAEYFLFQKTKESARSYLERGILVDELENNTVQFGADKDLGSELDVWVGKTFPSGINLELGLNYLAPGAALKQATTVGTGAPLPMDRAIYNLIFDLGFFF